MGPIGLVFLVVMLLFGVVGIVRGVAKELGVTVMLLAALMVLQLMDSMFKARITQMLNQAFGIPPSSVPAFLAICSALFLMLITFISYQGMTITYPIKSNTCQLKISGGRSFMTF